MALFQPTNIIPSSFTDGVVDAAQDTASISWQVNGNSPMTSYQIDFYQNDAESTPIASAGTGKISGSIPAGGFYGTDRFGQPKMFTWNAGQSWSAYNAAFTNGNQYKFKITQWYKGQDSVACCETSIQLIKGTVYYFKTGGENIVFTTPETIIAGTNDIYFSYTTGNAWVDTRTRIVVCSGYLTEESPPDAQNVTGNISKKSLTELFISQIESNVFIMRDTPQLTMQRSGNAEFSDLQAFPKGSTLPASIGYFVGVYSQAQGAPVREARWQVATWIDGKEGEILADTGDVDTPTLQFEFNGFFIGNEYAVRCSGKADYQTYGTQDFDSGWTNFTAKIPDGQKQNEYTGNFTVQCLPKENAALLNWEAVEVIPPSFTPDEFNPTTSNGSVVLPAKIESTKYSVEWKEKLVVEGGEPKSNALNFTAPWTAVWAGRINDIQYSYLNDITQAGVPFAERTIISVAAFSPDGKTLVLGGAFTGNAAVFSVNGTTITYVADITKKGAPLDQQVGTAAFSPDGKTLVLGGAFTGNAAVFSVNGTTITYVADIKKGNVPLNSSVEVAAFSPDGKTLVLGGAFTGNAAVFSVNGTTITYVADITWDTTNGAVYSVAFSPDGKTLVLGGGRQVTTGYLGNAFVYSVEGIKITQQNKINTNFGGEVYSAAFSPDGEILVLGGRFSKCYAYSVNGTNISYLSNIQRSGSDIGNTVDVISFSPDGRKLILGGVFSGECAAFSVNGTTITYVADITKSGVPISSSIVYVAKFSPDGESLIVAGTFVGAASVFKIKDYYPNGKLLNIAFQNNSSLTVSKLDLRITFNLGDIILATVDIPIGTSKLIILITPTNLYLYSYNDVGLLSQKQTAINYNFQSIISVSIYGGDTGSTVDSVSVYQGDGSNVLDTYKQNMNFEPTWNDSAYTLYMTANFNGTLDGGTGTATGSGFRIYRQEVGSNILTPIATLRSTETSLKDYGIHSRKAYKYSLYAYDNNGAFMQSIENGTVIATCFKNYSLLVCDYDSVNDEYHVRKQYLFALNLAAGSEGNNNTPTFNKNFTPYPTRMPDTANYISGTLQGLIGAIYTVPALVEQIGGFKHTAKPSTLDYFDSVDLEKELYDLSVAPYQLFLRDMKGHLRMVATNNQIGMTPDLKKRQIPLTISFPWVEIGDASDVTIIQTPDDYGWNNDGQVLDVRLDVDPTTGVLTANYPKPYDGTKFYLTGVHKEILGAKTPPGVTPAKFELSDVATESDDGILTATAKVNSEEE